MLYGWTEVLRIRIILRYTDRRCIYKDRNREKEMSVHTRRGYIEKEDMRGQIQINGAYRQEY